MHFQLWNVKRSLSMQLNNDETNELRRCSDYKRFRFSGLFLFGACLVLYNINANDCVEAHTKEKSNNNTNKYDPLLVTLPLALL